MAQYTIDTVVNRLDDIYTMLDIIAEKVEEVSFDDVVSEISDLKNVVISRPAAAAAAGTGTSGSGNGSIPNNFYSDTLDYLENIDKNIGNIHDYFVNGNGNAGGGSGTTLPNGGNNNTNNANGTGGKIISGVKTIAETFGIMLKTAAELINLSYEKTRLTYETMTKVFDKSFAVLSHTLTKSLSTTMGGIFKDNLIDVAYESYNNMLELAKENFVAQLDIAQDLRRYELDIYKANTKQTQAVLKGVGDVSKGVGSMLGPVGQAVTGAISAATSGANAIVSFQRNLSEKEQEKFIQYKDMINDMMKKTYESVQDVIKPIIDLSKDTSKLLLTIDKEGKKLGLSMGLSGANLEGFVKKQLKDATDPLITQFGKTAEDLLANQVAYRDASDRNIQLTTRENAEIFTTSALTGVDEKEIATMVGGMHQFNISAIKGNEMIQDIYKNANKLGVNATKAVKEFSNNLKLASKVNFKDGINGLKEMVTWSMKTRFNMESIGGMVDKIITGGLEGVMENAAKLSVIGGNASMYGDPLGMLYGAIDAQDLAERLKNSISDIGTYNRATGETTFSYYDRQRMKVIADAYGVSSEELDIMARTQKQRGDVERALGGSRSGFTEEQRDLINAHAKFDKEKGWVATIIDEFGNTTEKALSQLNTEDLKNLVGDDYEKDMVKYAAENLSEATKQTAAIVAVRNMLAQRQYGNWENFSKDIIDGWNKVFEPENIEEVSKGVGDAMKNTALAEISQLEQGIKSLKTGENGEPALYWSFSDQLQDSFKNLEDNTNDLRNRFIELNNAIKTGDFVKLMELIGVYNKKLIKEFRKEESKQESKIAKEQREKERPEFNKKIEELKSNKDAIGVQKALMSTKYESGVSKTTWDQTMDTFRDFWFSITHGKELKNTNNVKDASVTYPQTLITAPNSTVTKVNDGAVAFHKDDQIIAAKPGGGIYEMIRNTYDNISKMVQSPPPLQAPRNDVYRAEITVKLESKDGKVDITSIVRDTDGMRMITDRVLQTIAQKKTAFWINSNEI